MDKDHIEECKKIHSLISDDSTEKINLSSLQKLCKDLGENISDEELQEMIDEADKSGIGEVSQDDFIQLMKKINIF